MVQRCSNGAAFLVLEPEPSVRTGIRVDIFEGDNPLSLIARLPLTWGRRWIDPLKGTGSGEFWIHSADETLAANPGILSYGNIARFSLDERYRFAIQIEHLERVQVQTEEDVARTIKVSGRGVLSKLEEALLYPESSLAGASIRAFTDATAGEILGLAFDEAQARGVLTGLTRDFTDPNDSNNAPYDETLTLEERAGVSVLRIAERLGELASDVYMTPAGVLKLVNQRGIDRTLQLVDAGPVILQPADNLRELTRSEDGAIRNTLLIETPAGFLERTEGASLTEYGRREAFLSLGNISDSDAVDRASNAVFAQSADPAAQIGAAVTDKDGARPYVDWGIGDWVLAPDEDDQLERYRVRALTVTETKEGEPLFVPELATITEELEARLERWLSAMAKGTAGGTAAAVAEPVKAPVEVVEAVDAGLGVHLAGQPHFDEFADLADVDLTGVNAGDLLQFDGSDWIPLDGNAEGDMLARTDAGLWVPIAGTKATGRIPTLQASGEVQWDDPPAGGGGGGVPEWVSYSIGRLPSETPHTDDKFFDGTVGGTNIDHGGGSTFVVAESFDRLGLKLNSAAALDDIFARAWPLTPSSAPVTIETSVWLQGGRNIAKGYAIAFGFSDGTALTSNIAGWLGRIEAQGGGLETWYLQGTFTAAGITAGLNMHLPLVADPLMLRFGWTAANTFVVNFSRHPSLWTRAERGTLSRTLTPTHFWIGMNTNQTQDGLTFWDYVRVAEADLTI